MLLEFVYHTYGHHSAGKHIIFVFDVIELGTDFDSRFSKDAQMRIQPIFLVSVYQTTFKSYLPSAGLLPRWCK